MKPRKHGKTCFLTIKRQIKERNENQRHHQRNTKRLKGNG